MKNSSDPRDALADMLYSLKDIFKKYDRAARKEAWKSLKTGKGEAEVDKLLLSPSRPIVGIPKLLRFKEWLQKTPWPETPQ